MVKRFSVIILAISLEKGYKIFLNNGTFAPIITRLVKMYQITSIRNIDSNRR